MRSDPPFRFCTIDEQQIAVVHQDGTVEIDWRLVNDLARPPVGDVVTMVSKRALALLLLAARAAGGTDGR